MKQLCQFHPSNYTHYSQSVFGPARNSVGDQEQGMQGIASNIVRFSQMSALVSLAQVGIGDEKLDQMGDEMLQPGPLGNYAKLGKPGWIAILSAMRSAHPFHLN